MAPCDVQHLLLVSLVLVVANRSFTGTLLLCEEEAVALLSNGPVHQQVNERWKA
jgi:hypothetical protein